MRRGAWIIWLCLALLPLRGMAHALMLGAGAAHGAAAVQAPHDASSPCPMHVTTQADASPQAGPASADPGSLSGGSCHLCAVCHGVALPATDVAAIVASPPSAPPMARDRMSAGRVAPDGLFRPPR